MLFAFFFSLNERNSRNVSDANTIVNKLAECTCMFVLSHIVFPGYMHVTCNAHACYMLARHDRDKPQFAAVW